MVGRPGGQVPPFLLVNTMPRDSDMPRAGVRDANNSCVDPTIASALEKNVLVDFRRNANDSHMNTDNTQDMLYEEIRRAR